MARTRPEPIMDRGVGHRIGWSSPAVRGVLIGAWAALIWWLETRRFLRVQHDSKLVRGARNLTLAGAAGAVMQFAEAPVALHLAQRTQERRWGLLPRLPLAPPLRALCAILALDYTLYWWHFLTHRLPALWRFHQVHHLDRDMDATTALRFHFGEITISVLFRAGQMLVLGPTPGAVAAWQVFLFLCILFHHSNLHLPLPLERRLARFIVTPRLHGIHHSIAADQVNSNWSSGLTVWDWLHATLRTDVPQQEIIIGVAGHREGTRCATRALTETAFRRTISRGRLSSWPSPSAC